MNLSAQIVRVGIDVSNFEALKDAVSGQPLRCWKGNDLLVQLGFFLGTTLLGIGEIASVTLQIKATRTGATLIERTVGPSAFDAGLTEATWAAGTNQHVTLEISAAETDLLAITAPATFATFWIVIAAQTTHSPAKNLTVNAGLFTVFEDGYTVAGLVTPPAPVAGYYTQGEADARYLPLAAAGASARWYNGTWYHYEATTGLWYPLVPVVKDGVVTLGVGEGVSL
jgi:hypothetical protein